MNYTQLFFVLISAVVAQQGPAFGGPGPAGAGPADNKVGGPGPAGPGNNAGPFAPMAMNNMSIQPSGSATAAIASMQAYRSSVIMDRLQSASSIMATNTYAAAVSSRIAEASASLAPMISSRAADVSAGVSSRAADVSSNYAAASSSYAANASAY